VNYKDPRVISGQVAVERKSRSSSPHQSPRSPSAPPQSKSAKKRSRSVSQKASEPVKKKNVTSSAVGAPKPLSSPPPPPPVVQPRPLQAPQMPSSGSSPGVFISFPNVDKVPSKLHLHLEWPDPQSSAGKVPPLHPLHPLSVFNPFHFSHLVSVHRLLFIFFSFFVYSYLCFPYISLVIQRFRLIQAVVALTSPRLPGRLTESASVARRASSNEDAS